MDNTTTALTTTALMIADDCSGRACGPGITALARA